MNRILPIVLLFVTLSPACSRTANAAKPATSVSRKPVRVLIVDGFSNHDWQQTTALTRRILEGSGRFAVATSTCPPTRQSPGWETWRPRFADYDVVIQNCNDIGGGPAWPRAVQKDLEDYVRAGGGLYILHSANNAFPNWKQYNRMIGLGWRKKDFGPAITVAATGKVVHVPAGQGGNTSHGKRIDALLTRIGNHSIHRGLPQRYLAADLEIYRYARGPAEELTVLSYAREPKTGLNFPIEWVVCYGQGRVYNSTFGHVWKGQHEPPAMRCVACQTLLVRALEWLATGATTTPVPANFPDETKTQLAPIPNPPASST